MGPLLALALALVPVAPSDGYVGGFCAPFVLGERTASAVDAEIRRYEAHPIGEAEADAERPQDAAVAGQMFRLPGADAPAAFLDRHRGRCALVYPSAATPEAVRAEFSASKLPVGENDRPVGWRRVRSLRSGPPGPQRFFMKVGADDGFGLCSAVAEDLRLRDGRAVTLVTVSMCRLLPTETLDNG